MLAEYTLILLCSTVGVLSSSREAVSRTVTIRLKYGQLAVELDL